MTSMVDPVLLGQVLTGNDGTDYGWRVAISSDGQTVAISAPRENDVTGQVQIYRRDPNDGQWIQVGSDIVGEAVDDWSGYGLAISGDGTYVAIGADYNDGNGSNSGHVRIYRLNPTYGYWEQVGSDIDGEAADDNLGGLNSVSLSDDGQTVAVGAYYNDANGLQDSGHVRIYRLNPTYGDWEKVGENLNGEAANDQSGQAVRLSSDGQIVAIGAPYNGVNGTNSGHVRLYEWNGYQWTQLGSDIDGFGADDEFGRSIALSSDGQIVAIRANKYIRILQYDYSAGKWDQLGEISNGGSSDGSYGSIGTVELSGDGQILAFSDGLGASDTDPEAFIFTFTKLMNLVNGSKWLMNRFQAAHIYTIQRYHCQIMARYWQ